MYSEAISLTNRERDQEIKRADATNLALPQQPDDY
jgi:hypothetical protein